MLPRLAVPLRNVLDQRKQTAAEVEIMLNAHPLAKALTSMPGFGVRTASLVRLEVGYGSAFPTPGHLAAYAGLAPVTKQSGTSIKDNARPKAATSTSSTPCSWPPSPPSLTSSAGPTTARRENRANVTTPP
ncbi:transposase [Actinomadura sp. NEAU-AAG5]|uniref:Transposase n=1 Tax=Actinomadura litoris TaxID=2678616 RepID=A0A7K1KTP7_9ACTN|nr:transposase [Actinomadura litoris]